MIIFVLKSYCVRISSLSTNAHGRCIHSLSGILIPVFSNRFLYRILLFRVPLIKVFLLESGNRICSVSSVLLQSQHLQSLEIFVILPCGILCLVIGFLQQWQKVLFAFYISFFQPSKCLLSFVSSAYGHGEVSDFTCFLIYACTVFRLFLQFESLTDNDCLNLRLNVDR